MAYENLTTYTESDPGNEITVTSTKANCVDMETRLYYTWLGYDFGTDYFDDSFIHNFTLHSESVSGNSVSFTVWLLYNKWNFYYDQTVHDHSLNIDENNNIILRETCFSGTYEDTFETGVDAPYTYYVTVIRDLNAGDNGILYAYFFSDSDRQALVKTLSVALHTDPVQSPHKYRCYYVINTQIELWANHIWTGYVENIDLSGTPTAIFSGTPLSGYAPLEVTFTDSSIGLVDEWLWSFGDGETSAEQNPVHTYASAGVYDVSLTVTNVYDLSDTETKTEYVIVWAVLDTTVQTYLDELAVRLEDTEEKVFTDETKLIALNRSQLQIAENLKPEYMQDLLEIESSADISSGEYSISSLTYTLILDDQGIFAIKVTIDSTDYWAYKIDVRDVKRLDNPYFLPDYEVFYYVQNNKIYFKAGDGLSLDSATADIYYLKYPTECTLYVTPDLSAEYHWLWMALAEMYCWQMENDERAKAVGKIAQKEIEFIDYKFISPPKIIMGD